MKYITVLLSTVSLAAARLEVLAPLEPAADAPESWLQVCCQDNDKNDDGGISFREFKPFVLEIMDLDQKGLSDIFLAGDLDRNSDLDGNECPIIRAQLRNRMKQKVQKALKQFDSNSDNALDKDEIQKLAQQEFKLAANDADEVYAALNESPLSDSKVTDLLLALRTRQIKNAGGKLTRWDKDGDGKVNYEEMRRALAGIVPPLTLKQAFKSVDVDKDRFVSRTEFLSLLNELERSRINIDAVRTKRSDDMRGLVEDEIDLKDTRLLEKSYSQDGLEFLNRDEVNGGDLHRIFPRSETAPPVIDVDSEKISDSGEIDKDFARMIIARSEGKWAGGQLPSEVIEVVTVDFDDPEFQRFKQ